MEDVPMFVPEEIFSLGTTGVSHNPFTNGFVPSGYYNANYRKAVEKGFEAIRREALD